MDGRSLLTTVLAVLAAAQVSSSFVATQNKSPETPKPVAELGFELLKPDAAIAVDLEAGTAPSPDSLWIPQHRAGTITRVDAKNNTVDRPLSVGKPSCASLLVAFATVWVPQCQSSSLARVDAKHGNVSAAVPLSLSSPQGTIAMAAGSVWAISDTKGVVTRLDPDTNVAVAEVYVPARPFAVAAGDEAVWVTSEAGDVVTRINAHTNLVVESIKVGSRPGHIAVGEGAVWTLNRGDGSVTRIDSKSNKVVTTIKVDPAMRDGAIAVGEGSVWLSARGVPIVRIDPRNNGVAQRFTGAGGGVVVVSDGSVWIAAAPKVTWRVDPKLIAALRP